jgi:hypothetical protein
VTGRPPTVRPPHRSATRDHVNVGSAGSRDLDQPRQPVARAEARAPCCHDGRSSIATCPPRPGPVHTPERAFEPGVRPRRQPRDPVHLAAARRPGRSPAAERCSVAVPPGDRPSHPSAGPRRSEALLPGSAVCRSRDPAVFRPPGPVTSPALRRLARGPKPVCPASPGKRSLRRHGSSGSPLDRAETRPRGVPGLPCQSRRPR